MKTYKTDMMCRCGCGEQLGEISTATHYRIKNGQAVGYKKGHRFRGSLNPRYGGHKFVTKSGYRKIFRPDHPNSTSSGYVLEHRFVMSEHLGRPLLESEIVHHKNEDKLDNRICNLEITTQRDHYLIHDPNKWKRQEWEPKICAACKKEYTQKTKSISNHKKSRFCSHSCATSAGPWHPRRNSNRIISDIPVVNGKQE